jgi:4-hydroxythreonine-4-phosphate dehydrogenase
MNTKFYKPALAICLGDQLGLGPELFLHCVNDPAFLSLLDERQVLAFGDIAHLQQLSLHLGLPLPAKALNTEADSWLQLRHVTLPPATTAQERSLEAQAGLAAYTALEQAVVAIAQGEAEQLVSGPVSKAHFWQAGLPYSGQTEVLEALSNRYWPSNRQAYQADMVFVYQQYRTLLLTRHIPLQQVSQHLQLATAKQSVRTFVEFLRSHSGLTKPRLALMGLNPHGGEIGGQEEAQVLHPLSEWVNRQLGASCTPPLAADALMRGVNASNPAYDGYIAVYHDQGLMPVKLLGGLEAVNVSVGLPFLRTSVSHGMAADIVGQGRADHRSLLAACKLALQAPANSLPRQASLIKQVKRCCYSLAPLTTRSRANCRFSSLNQKCSNVVLFSYNWA